MTIKKTSYEHEESGYKKKPFMVGCSGGGGHIAAIQGIKDSLLKNHRENIILPQYEPTLYEHKPQSPARDQIATGIGVMHAPAIGRPIQSVVALTSYPVLPDPKSLNDEIQALSNKEKGKNRPYVDMLLDVCSSGYESAAIWNVLQRNDRTSELKKLIDLQPISDRNNYQDVLSYFVTAMQEAAKKGEPYTEIISTQAMALPALCDAAIEYNKWLDENPEISAPKVLIHQYMTDLPTHGAVHFFNALSTLSPEQQQQMKLYGVGMKEEIIQDFFPQGHQFNAICDIPAAENPMVRSGFKDPMLDYSSKFDEQVSITLAGEAQPYVIEKDEKIASIMLGSQASKDTIEYIETMLENGTNRVFVFGGQSPAIQDGINEIISRHPEYKSRIIPLGNQGDKEIAPLMSRSNLVVIRGGGLSVMEQLAMNHNKEQTVLVHHANSTKEELTSGISWEDENVALLVSNLHERGVHSEKTSPERAKRQIPEALLIAAVKKLGENVDADDITQYIKQLPDDKLELYVTALVESEKEQPSQSLPIGLTAYIEKCNQVAQNHIDVLNTKLDKGQEHLAQIISEEIAKIDGTKAYYDVYFDETIIENEPIEYDVKAIVHDFDELALKDASAELVSAVQSYKAIDKLRATISPDNTLSANKQLKNFKAEYEVPETKQALMSTGDNIFMRIIKEIEYQLAKIFPSLTKNFTFQQDFRMHMRDLRNHDNQEELSSEDVQNKTASM